MTGFEGFEVKVPAIVFPGLGRRHASRVTSTATNIDEVSAPE